MNAARLLEENFVPYASAKSVIQVIKRYRERGLPDPLTLEALQQVGITASMSSPTCRALLFLGLVDEAGAKTPLFENIRRATSDEYAQVLADAIRGAYSEIFIIADPAKDDASTIADAFRKYDPASQRSKMVNLFVGLCEEAGITEPRIKRRTREPATNTRAPKASTGPVVETVVSRNEDAAEFDFRLVSSIVQQLPKSGQWTSDKRQRWLDAMTSAIDLLIDVQDDPASTNAATPSPKMPLLTINP